MSTTISHLLVFDMDDTLYPEREFVRSAFEAVGAHARERYGLREFERIAWQLFEEGARQDIFQRTVATIGARHFESDIFQEFLQVYRHHRPDSLPWFPDARDFVEAMRRRFPIAVISDGYLPTQENKARALGLDELAHPLLFTEAWGREAWKPSPIAFLKVAEAHPQARERIYIADNPVKDFIAPNALGWRTVRVRRPGTEHAERDITGEGAAHMEVPCFRELQQLLKL